MMKKFIDLKGDFNPTKKQEILDTFNNLLEEQLKGKIEDFKFFSIFFEGSNLENTLHLYVKDFKESPIIGKTYVFPLNNRIKWFTAKKEDAKRRTIELILEPCIQGSPSEAFNLLDINNLKNHLEIN